MNPFDTPFSFSLSRLPQIELGSGKLMLLPQLLKPVSQRILMITGVRSFYQGPHWQPLIEALSQQQITWMHTTVSTEPSPQLVDDICNQFRDQKITAVVAIGGGSVLDCGKAVSGLLATSDSVMDYLEGVGRGKSYRAQALPFFAVPTTAGTGSEATKNAVLSVSGKNGFKKSFRDNSLVPQYAIVDPNLLESCPQALIAANGMDALTQLIESFVSTRANPFTDALALSGIAAVKKSLLLWYHAGSYDDTPQVSQARAQMAYAALLSGITLAQVGLGSVHGVAAPLGAFFEIPHGVACGTLLAAATAQNIELLQRQKHTAVLEKYAQLAQLLVDDVADDRDQSCQQLVQLLELWTRQMQLPRLSEWGMTTDDIPAVVANSRGNSMLTNPVYLHDDDIYQLIASRL